MSNAIKVWDPAVRLFHWLLLAAFVVAWATQEEHYRLHLASGYAVLGLVGFRIVWGLVGTRHARFTDFAFSPATVLGYLKHMAAGRARRYLGHNPAGGAMVIAILLCLLVACLSGVALDGAENRAGPLGRTKAFTLLDPIKAVHNWSSDIMVGLVLIHIAGVALASRLHHENLVRAMITGRKRA